MQDELKMQAELKKIIANSGADNTIEELSDEELEAVAGGQLKSDCRRGSKTIVPVWKCVYRSREYGGGGLV